MNRRDSLRQVWSTDSQEEDEEEEGNIRMALLFPSFWATISFFSKRKGLTHNFCCSWILLDLIVAEDLKLEVDQMNFFGAELVGDTFG